MPKMIDTMETMVGARIFSTMDLKSGFWQVKMAEESRPYTAFTVGSLGVYEFLRMPFGLCNAPATFQRLMQNCLGELNLTYALIYLDDIVVFSDSEAEHVKCLAAVFERFQEHGLKLKPSKCNFFRKEINYLGHRVSADGMRPGTENVEGIAEMAPPTTYTGIRRFLRATGFYRRFIKGYAKIVQPLNNLISEENSKLKGQEVKLTVEALDAFHKLKIKCMTAPVLAFTNFEKPFRLETDASGDGLGAVLSQKQSDGKYHPVAYASRSLKGSEAKYHSSKLEFLALKWAVVNQFCEYLQYKPFQVKTDNNPLTYVMTSPNLDATGHRWVAALANFNMSLEYQKGTDNKVADCLSRVTERLDEKSVKALIERAKASGEGVRAEADDPQLVCEDERLDEEVVLHTRALIARRFVFRNVADKHWVRSQQDDPVLCHVRGWMTRLKESTQTLSEYLTGCVPDVDRLAYSRHQKNFVMRQNLLYVETCAPGTRDNLFAFVVPLKKRQAALDGCHHEAGHQGRDRTLSLLREQFWWPGMAVQAMLSVKNCVKCRRHKARDMMPEMVTIGATEPMDLVHIDFVGMEMTVATKKHPW